MRLALLVTFLFALVATAPAKAASAQVAVSISEASSTGIGRLVLLDDRRVEAVLPDGTREVLESPELVLAIRELLPAHGKGPVGDALTGIGSKIVAILKAVFSASVNIARAMRRGAVVGWEFGERFNSIGANCLAGGAAAFFFGFKAFLVMTGGNPIAAVIGGAVMALGGMQVARRLEIAFKLVFAVGGVAVGAATGVAVYVLLPAIKAIIRLVHHILHGGHDLLRHVLAAARRATGEALRWMKDMLRQARRALVGFILNRDALADAARTAIGQIDAVLAGSDAEAVRASGGSSPGRLAVARW
jgi:hypothetical protein